MSLFCNYYCDICDILKRYVNVVHFVAVLWLEPNQNGIFQLAMLGISCLNSVGRSNMPLDIILKINQTIASNSIERVRKTW